LVLVVREQQPMSTALLVETQYLEALHLQVEVGVHLEVHLALLVLVAQVAVLPLKELLEQELRDKEIMAQKATAQAAIMAQVVVVARVLLVLLAVRLLAVTVVLVKHHP
jgi:hypothetical protein